MSAKARLALQEEVLLLALRDKEGTVANGEMLEYALGGALLSELLMQERVRSDGEEQQLKVRLHKASGVELLDEAWKMIAEARRTADAKTWVSQFAQIKRLRHRVAESLCDRGVLREAEDKILWVFTRKVYPEVNHTYEDEIVTRLHRAIFSNERDLDPRTAVLIALAHHAGLLANVFPRKELKERKQRVEMIAKGEAVGRAAHEAMEAMQAAILVACIMPGMTAAVISSS